MTGRNGTLEAIEGRTATLFLVAGGLLAVFAALWGVEAFTQRAAPQDIFGPAGLAVAFLGLLGLYPSIADRSPWLARVGAVTATIGVVGATVTSGWYVGVAGGVFPTEPPAYIAAFAIGILVGGFLAFPSFGAATLRSDAHSRTLGLLLLAPPVILGTMTVAVAVTGGPAIVGFIAGSAQAIAHLSIGYALRVENARSSRTTSTADPAA